MKQSDTMRMILSYDLLAFTSYFFKLTHKTKFLINWHHEIITDKLNEVLLYQHQTNRVIINVPPRMSKTELMINFTAAGFGINPASEFMFLSASDDLIKSDVSAVRKIMQTDEYKQLFNTTLLNDAKGSIITNGGGKLHAAPFFGQITGFGCGKMNANVFSGALVIDDPIKTQDALSETIREKVNFVWGNTIVSRINDTRTPIIIIAQRTHENDLCGYLIENEGTINNGGRWDVLSIPAIIDEYTEKERSMWPKKISLDELKAIRSLDKWVFGTQYQQDPKPIEGLMYTNINYYTEITEPESKMLFIDPADEGKDFLCAAMFYVKDKKVYVEEVLYDQKNTETLTPYILDMIKRHKPTYVHIESNAAWMIFAKALRAEINKISSASVRCYISKTNKEIRIFNEAPSVQRNFYFKIGKYELAMKHLTSYLKMVKDQKDDFPDVLTAASEYLKQQKIIDVL